MESSTINTENNCRIETMLKIDAVDPSKETNYNRYLDNFKRATSFHTSDWASVIAKTYGYRPFYIIAKINEDVRCVLPLMEVDSLFTGRRAVSLPFTDFCEPLIEDRLLFEQVLAYVYELGEKRCWRTIEFRGGNDLLGENKAFKTFFEHSLKLNADMDFLFKSFRDSVRRNIKKAKRLNVKTLTSNSFDAVEKFYRLNCLTRRKHGLPPQPFSFFKNIFKDIIAKKKGYVVLANIDDNVVAGAVFLTFKNKVIYKYGASDPKYLNSRANNQVMWHSLKMSVDGCMKDFNFGRTEPDNAGLIQFKNGWNTIQSNIFYYKYNMKTKEYLTQHAGYSTNFLNKSLQHFPLSVLKGMGKLLYKHIG